MKKECERLFRQYANLQLSRIRKKPPIMNDWTSNWISVITEDAFYIKDREGKKHSHHVLQRDLMKEVQSHTDMPLIVTQSCTEDEQQRLSFVLEDVDYMYGMGFVDEGNGTFIYGKGVYNSDGLIAYTTPVKELSKIELVEKQIKIAISQLPAYRLYHATGMLTFKEIS